MISAGLYSTLLLALTSQSLVSAQSATTSSSALAAGLSTSCQTAAGALLTSEFSTCANVIGLVSVLGATGSVLTPLDAWIKGVCTGNPCSNATLSTASASVSSGCSGDVQKGVSAAVGLNSMINNYSQVRSLLCTQYTANSTYCVTSVLGNVQTATGKNITLAEVMALLTTGLTSVVSSIPSSTYCTDCGKALFIQSNSINVTTASGNVTSGSASSAASNACGASFVDGKMPSSVRSSSSSDAKTTASTNAQTNSGVKDTASVASMSIFVVISLIGFCVV